MPKQRITDEEKAAVNRKLSEYAKARWADPKMRAKISAAQSKGTTEAWADPNKAAQRLLRREERAKELGFDSYGQLVANNHMHKSAEACGVTLETYAALSPGERKLLRRQKGVSHPRKSRD